VGVAIALAVLSGCSGAPAVSAASARELLAPLLCVGPLGSAPMGTTEGVASEAAVCNLAGDHQLFAQRMATSSDRNTIESTMRRKGWLCGGNGGYVRGANWIVWASDETVDLASVAASTHGELHRC
jgi:hypothetical protein